mgnify:CR=1 FL=1
MKKVLITGYNGYIGSHLTDLLQDDYELYGIDFAGPPKDGLGIHSSQDDIRDEWFEMNGRFDTIVHLAAMVRVNESVRKPSLYYDVNINGLKNILDHCDYGNFIFASTGAAEKPISPYAISKLAGEHLVREKCDYLRVSHTIFRFYNVIGSAGFPPTNPDGLFYNLIKAKETGVFNLYGNDYNTPDGTPIRDYVHVMEICNAIKLAIEKPSCILGAEVTPLVENLGHGKGHSVLEMANTFQKVNNCSFKINTCQKRPGDLEYSVLADVSPYMQELYSFEELMKL